MMEGPVFERHKYAWVVKQVGKGHGTAAAYAATGLASLISGF
jgi:hypothetical protein